VQFPNDSGHGEVVDCPLMHLPLSLSSRREPINSRLKLARARTGALPQPASQ
jgi:hypothetical protein